MRLEPVYKTSIWAGERLKKIRGLSEEGIGICREVCAYRGSENRIAEGQFQGWTINQVITAHHKELMGDDDTDQLVRVAYMDTVEDLSVQVHPGQRLAEKIGDYEKSESWYIVEADEGAYITAGIHTNDVERLRQEAEKGELESYLVRYPVKKGDFAMIPAGMVHACGKNMLALEIGSFGGITYRLYDYGRGRALDLDKSFEVLNPDLLCEIQHLQEKEENVRRQILQHNLFSVDVADINGCFDLESKNRYHIITCVEHTCSVWYQQEEYPLDYTQTLLIPAMCDKISIKGKARILISYRS